MSLKYPANPELLTKFCKWWNQNQNGGWSCRWRRRSVWKAQVLQKLGRHQEVTAPVFWDERMHVVTGETVSQSILAFGYSEVAITALMLWLIRRDQTVIDVGTHFGYEALLACKLVGVGGQVLCFEPAPKAFAIAQKNLTPFPQAQLRQQAISEQSGVLALQDRAIWESAFNRLVTKQEQNDYTEVHVTTLDSILESQTRPIDFLKCDVEGFEMAVLKGAHKLLCQVAPVLVLEADMPSPEGKPSKRAFELASYLERYNYQALSFNFDGKLRLGELGSIPTHHANIAFIPQTRPDILASV